MTFSGARLLLCALAGGLAGGLLPGCLLPWDADGDGLPWTQDCDDNDPEVLGSVKAEVIDVDGDGYGGSVYGRSCGGLVGGRNYAIGDDCDDHSASVNPDAAEICGTGVDEDCDGAAAECEILGELGPEDVPVSIAGPAGEQLGSDLAVGDLDNDGVSDLVLGARDATAGSAVLAGRVYVLYGPIVDSVPDITTAARASLDGESAGGGCGSQLDVGDFDGDGFADLVLGCPDDSSGGLALAGTVALRYGGAARWRGAVSVSEADLRFVALQRGDSLGMATRFVGDLNGDGGTDLVLGASLAGDDDAGAVYVFAGGQGRGVGTWDTSYAALVIRGARGDDQLGHVRSVAGPVDLDGDGLADLVLGARQADADLEVDAGAVFVFYGGPWLLDAALDVEAEGADLTLAGDEQGALLGREVAPAGDVTGDGYTDLLVGAVGMEVSSAQGAGCLYLIPGASGRNSGVYPALNLAQATLCAFASGAAQGSAATGTDLDIDGFAEVVVGAFSESVVEQQTGTVRVFYGPLSGAYGPSDAQATLTGAAQGEQLGYSVRAGDVSGDGAPDLLVGAVGADLVYLFNGGGR